jgi:hypothetical protein
LNNNGQNKFEYTLVKHDSLLIPLPDTIPDIDVARTWANNDKYLSFLTDNNEIELFLFNYDNHKWSNLCLSCLEERIEYYGPYDFINDSLILYAQAYKNNLLIININKKTVVEKFAFSPDYGPPFINHIKSYSNDSLIILPAMYLRRIDKNYTLNSKLAIKINKKTKEVSYFGQYPTNISFTENTSINLIVPDIIFHSNSFVVNFKDDMYLHILNYDTSIYKSILCRNEKIKQQNLKNNTGNEIKDALIEEFNGLYKDLLYDEINNIYYRISVSYKEFNGNLPNSLEEVNRIGASRKIMVIVLDSNFNILTKTELSGLSETNCFTKNGKLYLRTSNKNENAMKFIGYKLFTNKIKNI